MLFMWPEIGLCTFYVRDDFFSSNNGVYTGGLGINLLVELLPWGGGGWFIYLIVYLASWLHYAGK
jgi:hypothetical protein